MKSKIFIVFLVTFGVVYLALSSSLAVAKTYYVDNNLGDGLQSGCSDNNNGLTLQSPLCSIQKAANNVQAGDTVYIRGGNYNERVTISKSGTASNHITISGYNNENVVVDGQNSIGSPNLFIIKNTAGPVQYVDISKITIANSVQNGMYVVDGQYITLDNLIIKDNYDVGLNLLSSSTGSTHDVTIKNCYIFRNGNVPTHGDPGLKIGAKDAFNVYNILVENCVIHDNAVGTGHDGDHGDGINPTGNSSNVHDITFKKVVSFHNGASGLGVRMGKNINVEDSIFFDNNINVDQQRNTGNIIPQTIQGEGYGARFTFDPGDNINIFNSISFNNWGPGIALDYMKNANVYNNLVYRNANGVAFEGIKVDPNGGVIKIRNNVAYNNPPLRTGYDIKIGALANGAIINSDHNFFSGDNPQFTRPPVNGYDLIGVYSNDLVTYDDIYNQLKDKFAPKSGSPLIDAGVLIPGYHCLTSGTHTRENCKEWYGNAPDIGPFEFSLVSNSSTTTSSSTSTSSVFRTITSSSTSSSSAFRATTSSTSSSTSSTTASSGSGSGGRNGGGGSSGGGFSSNGGGNKNIDNKLVVKNTCQENWVCGEFGSCIDGKEKRTCREINGCDTIENKPIEEINCISGTIPPIDRANKPYKLTRKINVTLFSLIFIILSGVIIFFVIYFLLFKWRRVK